jgi:MoxR-like ATPase
MVHREKIEALRQNVGRAFYGNRRAVDLLIVGMLARGHILIEDVPGLGKTVLARALARSVNCHFSRIQLTPDLLPSDVLGVSVFNQQAQTFEFKRGPIFANIVLADEINRTTPRTQSALLEAMSEEQVSWENQTIRLERPFMVIATQNPFEFEGTYHLPENQLDRFLMRIDLGYPEREDEYRVLTTQPSRHALQAMEPVLSGSDVVEMQDVVPQVKLNRAVVDYILNLVEATRRHPQLHLGVSTRGALALTQATQAAACVAGRDYATPDDVKMLAPYVLAHRVISKSYLQDGSASASPAIIREILDTVAVPA